MDYNVEALRVILNSIYKKCWVEIKYKNSKEEIKNFWICIKDIIIEEEKFKCDSLSLDEDKTEVKEITVLINRILEARILEDTCLKNNEELITKIENNIWKMKKIFPSYDFENILSYLEECIKYDTVPFKTDIETIWGIDQYVLKEHGEYKLNKEQINQIKKYMSVASNATSSYRQLGMNILSINYSNNISICPCVQTNKI